MESLLPKLLPKLLIDECLHTSLLDLAHAAGYAADHVNYLGLGGSKDWQLMTFILARDYTFVTNNRTDFLALYSKAPVHTGLVVIVPNAKPALQRELFRAALNYIGQRELVNAVVEVDLRGKTIECRHYLLPPG
ncbi:MAG TPA: DUF5615 family PIN-like protein [Terracidiphilus sp.]|nr:DUF5615 family PIN-like protein [Terracidiphilus sp.]